MTPARVLPLLGMALLGGGMCLVIGGVVVRGLFMPGVYVLILGFLLMAAAAIAGLLRAAP